MADYTRDHASAYADVLAAGAAITVTRSATDGESADGTMPEPAQTSIACVAYQKKSDPARFAELGLTLATSITLSVVPATYGLRVNSPEFVKSGDLLPWAGITYTVRDVGPAIAPDGLVIISDVVATV